jgi:hypothetical protein
MITPLLRFTFLLVVAVAAGTAQPVDGPISRAAP